MTRTHEFRVGPESGARTVTTETTGCASADARAVFDRIAGEAASTIGFGLFTVTAFAPDTMQVERVYSTDPSHYPVGGRKAKRDTAFARQVLGRGEPIVCEGDAAIADMFDDHATIRGCGLHASINAPVIGSGGCVIGVLNILLRSERVLPAQVAAATVLARDRGVIDVLAAHIAPVRPGRTS